MITFSTTDGISNFIETVSLSVFGVGGAVGASAAAVLHAAAGADLRCIQTDAARVKATNLKCDFLSRSAERLTRPRGAI